MFLPHAAGVMYDLKMVIPFTVCYAVLGYSLKTGISWFYAYYVVSSDMPLIWDCHIFRYGLK